MVNKTETYTAVYKNKVTNTHCVDDPYSIVCILYDAKGCLKSRNSHMFWPEPLKRIYHLGDLPYRFM
jgi:hypothetical protein